MDYQKILVLCEQKNISPTELAGKIGITRQGLLKAIKKQSMNINIVEFIAKTLNVSVMEFIEDEHILKLKTELLDYKERNSTLTDQFGGEQMKSEMWERECKRIKTVLAEKEQLLLHYSIILKEYEKKMFPEADKPKE